jgi:hypothetical protein
MRKLYAITCILLVTVFLGLVGCTAEPVTTTVTQIKTVTAAPQTVTSMVTAPTVTVTQSTTEVITQTVTATPATTAQTTSQSTDSSTTTSQGGDFDPSLIVIEVDNATGGMLRDQNIRVMLAENNALLIRGELLSPTPMQLIAIITCTYFDENGTELGVSEELRIQCPGSGSVSTFSFEYDSENLSKISRCVIMVNT